MTVTDIVTIRGLDHSYGRTHALRGVDLTVGAGECVALLGPNGAGKTTLVSTLTGTLAPDAGTVRITGNDPRRPATRRRLGVVHQHAGFPRTLRVHELVGGWAVRAGRPASGADAVLAEVGLSMAVGFVARGRSAPAIINAVFLPMAIAGGLWMPLEVLPAFVQDLAVWLPTYHTSQLGLGLLVGEPIGDNVAALLAATAVTASLAAIAYRSMRAE
jgi:ABC-type Fe3+/spermidine/putrescine transport system ATPase subunit